MAGRAVSSEVDSEDSRAGRQISGEKSPLCATSANAVNEHVPRRCRAVDVHLLRIRGDDYHDYTASVGRSVLRIRLIHQVPNVRRARSPCPRRFRVRPPTGSEVPDCGSATTRSTGIDGASLRRRLGD
jgi:hypothetical protein